MKVLVLSSLARDTGCWLRAGDLACALGAHGPVRLARPMARCLPLMLDVILSTPVNIVRVLASDADWVVGIKPFPDVTLPLLLGKWLRGKRIAVDVDDLDELYFAGWRRAILRRVLRPPVRRFDLVTYHNEALRPVLVEEFGVAAERVARVEQGVDLGLFHGEAGPVEAGSLLYAGHLNIASELPFLLEAVARVQARRRAPLVVAGGGPCEGRFRALARELGVSARFTGPQRREQIVAEMARAEVCLVYHSEREVNRYRCSMKLRESLAMNKKVVCNGFGELAQFAALTYAAGPDADSYADTVCEALDAGDGRELQGATFVREHMDWRDIAARLHRRLSES